jgi:hypothetical protein
MIGDLLLTLALIIVALAAGFGGIVLSLWLSLRAPILGLALAGIAVLALAGLWLRSAGI